jgi:hypothetical protein
MRSQFAAKVVYTNNLPELPFEPKLFSVSLPTDRLVRYEPTSIERLHQFDLLTEQNFGLFIDLVDMDVYKGFPGKSELHVRRRVNSAMPGFNVLTHLVFCCSPYPEPILAEEDEALLIDDPADTKPANSASTSQAAAQPNRKLKTDFIMPVDRRMRQVKQPTVLHSGLELKCVECCFCFQRVSGLFVNAVGSRSSALLILDALSDTGGRKSLRESQESSSWSLSTKPLLKFAVISDLSVIRQSPICMPSKVCRSSRI